MAKRVLLGVGFPQWEYDSISLVRDDNAFPHKLRFPKSWWAGKNIPRIRLYAELLPAKRKTK